MRLAGSVRRGAWIVARDSKSEWVGRQGGRRIAYSGQRRADRKERKNLKLKVQSHSLKFKIGSSKAGFWVEKPTRCDGSNMS